MGKTLELSQRRADADNLLRELADLVPDAPGAQPLLLQRARCLEFRICQGPYNAYTREKIGSLVGWMEIWCSARKWQKWDLASLRCSLDQAVYVVKSGINSDVRD